MANKRIDIHLPLHTGSLKMRTRQSESQTTWRTFSWAMNKSEAQITSAETTMAVSHRPTCKRTSDDDATVIRTCVSRQVT